MIAVWWYYLLCGFMVGLIAWLVWKWEDSKKETAKWRKQYYETFDALLKARDRAWDSDKAAEKIVQAVLPLVEKTDWMTGRWAGRMQELVRLENQRNDAVAQVQREIQALPAVKELNKVEVLAGAGQVAGQALYGGYR